MALVMLPPAIVAALALLPPLFASKSPISESKPASSFSKFENSPLKGQLLAQLPHSLLSSFVQHQPYCP